MKLKTNFGQLLDRLAEARGVKRVSTNSLAKDLGVKYRDADNMRKDKIKVIYMKSLDRYVKYFQQNGLEVDFNDLFVWAPEEAVE